MFIFGLIVGFLSLLIIRFAVREEYRHFTYFMFSKKIKKHNMVCNNKYNYKLIGGTIKIYSKDNDFKLCSWNCNEDKFIYNIVINYFI